MIESTRKIQKKNDLFPFSGLAPYAVFCHSFVSPAVSIKAAVLFAYDVLSQVGDLGYYDGKGVTMLDEDITALFMY